MTSYQYLYGFTRAHEWAPLLGVGQTEVTAVTRDGLSAVTSAFGKEKVRPQRRNLLAHDQTLRALLPVGILPVAFGTLTPSTRSLETLLLEHHDEIESNLDRLEGRVEMAAKARIVADNIFERYVTSAPKLEEARDRMVGEGRSDRDTLITVGKLFTEVVAAERKRVEGLFVDGVGGETVEIRSNEPKQEAQIFDLAFLLERDGVEKWEAAVDSVAIELDDDLMIDLAGPLPPYSFSTLVLSPPESRDAQ